MTDKRTTRVLPPRAWIALACLCVPATGLAGFLDDDLNYEFESGSDTRVCVSGLRNTSTTQIVIPSTVEYEWQEKDGNGQYQTRRRTCDVKSIRTQAFYNRSGLASVTIGDKVTTIGEAAFRACTSLATVTIPDNVGSIGNQAFYGCSSLATVAIGNGVTNIGQGAFCDCSSLVSVTIPDNVESIGNQAFQSCSGLATVVIGNGVTSLGRSAFNLCGNVTSFSVASGNPNYTSVDGLLLTKDGTTLINGVNRNQVTIPDSVTNVCDFAFRGCQDVTSVVIPDSVELLGTMAFDGCGKLWTSWYRTLANQAASGGGSGGGGSSGTRVSLTVTNVVLHYVTQSVPSGAVVPPLASGLVNVVTEIGAGRAVAIPSEWAEQYPGFAAKFGSDFREAVTQPTGKRDGAGNAMFVWQDFVAGTDPTDESDVFTASITFDATTGEPVVSWSPELSATEAAKRVYTVFGKVRLNDTDWTLVDGNASDYNFFKVRVEMK